MLDFDPSKLRAQVIHDYELLALYITDAAEMNRLAEAVVTTAVGVVREQLHVFNQENVAARLPAELLAACFLYLPFRYCIAPSQVCRFWRAAALTEPRVWAKISPWSPCNRPELLQMALSRAGALPVDLKVDARPPTDPETVYTAIAPFSSQLRYLAWYSDTPISPWDFPAPILEGFCTFHTMTITSNLFGGHAGRLRCLYLQCVHLPPSCPVLSTVTELAVLLTPHEEGAAPSTLGNVFELFPRLQWFQILGITTSASNMLPSGPAPTSLTELVLNTMSWDYDLMPHYLAWGAGNLHRVSLSQYPGTLPDLAPLVNGTITLAFKYSFEPLHTSFMFEHSDTVSHSVTMSKFTLWDAASLLAALAWGLSSVQIAKISHETLRPLSGVLAGLPALEHLFLHIMPQSQMAAVYPHHYPHPFSWEPLSYLPDVVRTVPTLMSITLQVWCDSSRRRSFTNADNAHGLISQLRALGSGLPPISVQGFPAEEVSSIDLAGLNVRFDVFTEVGDLVLRKDHEIYYPFKSDW